MGRRSKTTNNEAPTTSIQLYRSVAHHDSNQDGSFGTRNQAARPPAGIAACCSLGTKKVTATITNAEVIVWNAHMLQKEQTLVGHNLVETKVVSAESDRTARVWDRLMWPQIGAISSWTDDDVSRNGKRC